MDEKTKQMLRNQVQAMLLIEHHRLRHEKEWDEFCKKVRKDLKKK